MKSITAAELDEKFDNGEDISEYLDWENAWSPGDPLRADLDLPYTDRLLLDAEAQRLGLSRNALIETWLKEKLAGLSDAAE